MDAAVTPDLEEEEEDISEVEKEEKVEELVPEIAPVVINGVDDEETNGTTSQNENEIEINKDEEEGEEEEKQNEVDVINGDNVIKTEFTYTSLTSFDDINSETVTNGCQIVASKSVENGFQSSTTENRVEKPASIDNQQQSDLNKIIEKLKSNQITNKEVVNYILNLLVGGEFDLEKNFIIKNVNNILCMMQVIKCANTSLKAEIWSLFTAILRKSQRNLQACVDVGLIEAALHELKDADSVCAGKLLIVLENSQVVY